MCRDARIGFLFRSGGERGAKPIYRVDQLTDLGFGFVFRLTHNYLLGGFMSALYAIRYLGSTGVGFGSVYIGKNVVVGIDVANGRYNGTYTEEGGRLKLTGNLSAPPGGAVLVTGDQLPAGQSIPLIADWPTNFADGSTQQITVMGKPVQVTFEKVGDIP